MENDGQHAARKTILPHVTHFRLENQPKSREGTSLQQHHDIDEAHCAAADNPNSRMWPFTMSSKIQNAGTVSIIESVYNSGSARGASSK